MPPVLTFYICLFGCLLVAVGVQCVITPVHHVILPDATSKVVFRAGTLMDAMIILDTEKYHLRCKE